MVMSGMVDRLIHAYFGIDYHLGLGAIKNELTKIKPQIEEILDKN